MLRRSALLFSGVLLLALSAQAQERLLSPAAFLGYELGSRFTPHHRVVDYVEHVAAHSPNVRLEPYGETYEGRPLLVAFVSTPGNLARLEEIRTDNLKATGLLPGTPAGEPAAIVWLSYNVHGNESVSSEAAMATLYALANPADPQTQPWLAQTVVVLDPVLNPDGRERYVQWYRQTRGRTPDPDPDAREHHEPWPGGRFNHYLFDLNRDWAWMTQQETRHRLALYNAWMPHVHVDFHEQRVDEPYYFAPAAEPFHEAITPWQRAFQTTIGRGNAAHFDATGRLYFTRQVFDLFYPGYGDTWPTFNGAIGMTYEQGGSGRAGLAIRTAEGDTLTLRERIENHYTTGLSTVETTARDHERVVAEFRRYFDTARNAPAGPYKTFVVRAAAGADRLAALAAHLDAQGIRYGYAGTRRAARGFDYAAGREASFTVEPGDLVVSSYQPKSVLAATLFDPDPALPDSLTYDITAWALPYVYGLDAYALPERLDAGTGAPPPAPAAYEGPERPYAYLSHWQSFRDLRFLAAALEAGLRPRVAEHPFEIGGRSWAPGTLILTRTGHEALGEQFDARVRAVADAVGQPLYGVATGFVTRGADFGSPDVRLLERPRVAVLAGPPVSPTALGEVWHFFDEQLGYRATLVDADDFDQVAWHEYDVLVVPDGSYASFLAEARLTRLREWIQQGGRLIALEGAVKALSGKSGFAVEQKARGAGDEDSLATRLRPYGARERTALSEAVPGAVYRATMDPTHPLAFGYGETYHTLKRSGDAFAFLDEGWNVGVLREDARVSGFTGHAADRLLHDSLLFGVQPMGRGEVVYMVDDPLFRGFWYNGRLLFGNAVFLVGG